MADVESNIHVNIDTSDALASLKLLQRQISAFHTQMAKSGTAASAVAANQAQNLINSINATGKFQASMQTVTSSTESFTDALERNKLSSREYFRYTGAATKTFGRLFKSEFETLNKVARERVKDLQTQYIKMGRGANGALQAIAVRPLTLDMKNLGTQTAIAAQRQQLLNQLLKQGSTNLLNFGKNTQWAGRQLMVGFTVPLAMLGIQASQTFMKLEEQAIRFKRVYGEMFTTQAETDAMVKQVQKLATEYTKYGVAIEDTMKMAADAAAMGKQGAELLAQISQATRLAVLGGVDQAQALETTISVTNAFGVAADQLAGKIDFLNAVENQTVVSIEDLTTAIPKAGPVVKQLGGSVEDLAFFLTAMKEGGINASEGANALKSGLASLINPSKKASDFLGNLGVNIKGIVEANKGDIKATVVGFAQALDTLDPLNRARAIEQLFGKFQFSRLSTLFQNVTAQGTQANRVLQLTQATTEELAILSQRELDKIQNTTTYKFKKSMEDLKLAIAPVGEQFLKALTPIVEFVGKILDKFNNLGEGSKKFLTIFTVAVAGVGPILLMTFGLIANAVANIIKMFVGMKSMYTRTGSASKVLGEQTNYLTKEQLEASAVAASLDQVHIKLNQTFTSETTAVNMLANAYRRAIAAQAGFTGPPAGKKMPKLKYSTGTTRVPGTGNQDTVFSMLTPGEAVIPAQAAQDPANRPVISAMIAGKKMQGYNQGTEDAQEVPVKSKRMAGETQKFHVGAKNKMHIDDILKTPMSEQKAKTLRLYKEILLMQGIEPKILVQDGLLYDFKSGYNQAMSKSTGGIPISEWSDEWVKRGPEKWKPSGINAFDAKAIDGLILETIHGMNPKPTLINDDLIRKTLFETIPANNPKIASSRTFGLMRELHSNIASFSVQEGFGTKDPESTRKILEKAKGLGIIKDYEYDPGKSPDKRRIVLINHDGTRSNPFRGPSGDRLGTTSSIFSGFREAAFGERNKQLDQLEKDVKASPLKGSKPETYSKQITPTSGRSFTALKGLGGVYEMADGKRVFVKPANSYREALAEQRATTIARNVHGLDAPEQTIKTILDPTDTKGKRRIVVLESPFDPRFDPEKMSNTFTKEEYIKQNVAAALRADKDLGKGNLSGNILADVGPAGVFGTASGSRDFVANLPSMEEQARINLGIDTPLPGGGRKKFFSEATAKIARSMTADEYHRAMINEINTSIPKLEKVIESFGITNPKEKKVYQAMLDRLKEGAKVDWRQLHKLHSSIAVKPDEVLQDTKTGKITKPKTAKLPSGVKSSAGSKDTRMTQEPAGKRIVQAPKRIGKVIIPGKANAPDATTLTTTSQSAAAASRTALYGGGTIDADAKSLRRQMEKRQRAEARTQAKAAASRTALYGQKVIDAEEKSFRRQREAQEKRSKLAERVAYRQSIISEKAAAEAAAKTPSARLKTFAQAKIDKYNANKQARIEAGKNPRMGAAGALGLASGAAMIGSMAPGKVGEISQKIMMPLMGLSMVLPMMKSPMSALAVGLIATVGSFVALRMAFDSAQSKVLEEADKFKGSASAVQAIAKFSGKATASEQMDLRRKNSFSMLGPATGKTTYGEAFVQTAEGKALTARISEQNAKGKGNAAAKDLTGQLSASIMSGAMDMSQAKSLAMNAARQAGDMSIGIKVIAQLESLLGPNGENLINDPLNVRINMINANAKSMQGSINNIGNANPITKLAGQKTMQTVGIGASALGGAAIGATIGAALGTVVPVLGNAVGAIIGGGIGAAAGAIGGYFASKKFVKEAGTLGAAYAVDAKMAMEQNKQMLDSFDMFYQKKIEQLKLQGKINEAEAMQTKYISERDKLTAAQSALQGNVVSQYNNAGGLQEAMMSGMKKATTAKYKNDPNQLAYVDVVNQQAGDLRKSGAINSGQEFLIQAKMASGDIPPAVFRSLLQMATDNKDIAPKMMNIITKFSGATSESIGVAAQNILGSDGVVNKTVQTKFVTRVEAFEKDSDALDFAKNIIKLNNLNAVIPSDVMVSYYTDPKNKDAYEKLNKILDTIEGSKDLTAKIVYEIMPEIKGTAAFDEAYFNTLTEDQQKVYTTTISSLINIPEPQIIESEDFKAWRKETGPKGGAGVTGSKSFIVQKYIEAQGNKAVTDGVAVGVKAPVTADTSGTGNKVQASPLDDLVKKLRDVRMNQIKVTEGWSASRKALDKLFGGKKTIDVFSGIENDIRKLGGSQDFIELIVGMDPKEYEKRKNSLFKFDNKGNIISLKNDAKNIQEAMNSIAMGDWNSSMEAESQALADQGNAFSRIANLGVPVADAYDLITNKTIAQAIANGVNDKTLKTLIERYKGLTAAQEKSAAIQGVKTDIAQFKKDRIQEARIKSQYDPTTAFAISSDDNLKLMENTISTAQAKVDSLIKKGATRSQINAAQGDLNTLVTDFNERLNQLKNTIGFMQDMFDKGYSNAMQSFDTQETALNIQFKLDTKGNDKTIREAQDQIAAIQYKVDGKDAALKVIADEEQKINDKYDERINALDEIEKVNAAIYSQQKGQLTLAEALTSGDIAAAARAAQDMRSQAAADAVTKQKDAVEQSRKYELAGVQAYDPVTKTYRTRKELESDIKKLQDEIFSLEQDKIKPAEELNRLRQIQLDKDVAGLTVLGRTKDAWEAIKNQVDLALIKSAAFVDSMGLAISTQSKLIAAYAAETGGKNGAFNNQGAFVTGAGIDPATQAAADAASQAAAEAKAKADAIAAMDKALKGKDDGTSNSLGFYNSLGSDGEKGKTAEQNAAADAAARAAAMDKALQGKDGRDAAGSSSLGFYNSLGSDGEKGNTAAGNIAADAATLGNQTAQGYANKIAAMDRAMRGRDGYLSSGGLVPKYFAVGGFARGTDTVPAMLTPGEFIMSKYAVDAHGINTMKSINSGQPTGGAVYNNTYTLTVNAKTDANPNEIAKAVMSTIKQVDDRRVRGVVLNGR
jgi:TP901 family phage tail tape measure protein